MRSVSRFSGELLSSGPELKASKKYDLRRLREQARYFGLVDETRATYFGKRAKRFTERQLQAINGIGPVYSKRIIENRPYEKPDDLYEVENIPSNTIKRAIPFLEIEERQSGR